MHIISKRPLRQFVMKHPDAESSLRLWQKVAEVRRWNVRQDWPTADPVGKLTVFNISGNKYRLVTYIDYGRAKVFICHLLTHEEYSKGDWKRDPWY
jgi:mRNA interferase HigB